MNALLLPTEHGKHCAIQARIPETARDTTTKGRWCGTYHWTL